MLRARLFPMALPLVLAPSLARAEPHPRASARLDYTRGPGAESCPAESGLRLEVARRLGYDPFTPDARAHLAVTITDQGDKLTGSAQFTGDGRASPWSRAFPGREDDCAALISALGAEISYQLDPFVVPPAPVAPSPPPAPAPALPSTPPPPAPASPPPSPTGARAELTAGARVTAGAAPGVAFGATLGGGLRWPAFSLSIEVRVDAPASDTVTAPAGARVRTFAAGGALIPCGHLGPMFGCGVIAASAVSGSSEGVDMPRSDVGPYVGAGARIGLEAPLSSRFAIRLLGEGLASVRSVRLILDGAEVWKTAPLSGSVGTGLVAFF
jgi:hypothetical protein